jgi:hypothetical protein
MKKLVLFLMLGLILIPMFAFGGGAELPSSEAIKSLEKQFGYPKTEYVDLWFEKDVADAVLSYLLKDGYITAVPKPVNARSFRYPLTEMGMSIFGRREGDSSGVFTFHSYESNLFLAHVACARTVIKMVQNMSVDSKEGLAVVRYFTIQEPVEPLYSSVCVKSEDLPSRINLSRSSEHSAKLRKYKEGWRAEE